MRTRTITATALAAAALAGGPAAAQNTGQEFTDAIGDVATQAGGVYYVTPDIISGRVLFTDGNDFAATGDDLLGFYATVDSKPAAGITSELFSVVENGQTVESDYLGVWINTDGNAATGASPGTVALGADARIVITGVVGGQPSTARVDTWSGTAWITSQITASVVKVNTDFGVVLAPQSLGLQRGARFAYQVVTTNESVSAQAPNGADFTPDTGEPLAFTLPALGPPVTVQSPAAATTQARSVGTDRATLAGTVDPHGQGLTWWFEWGTTTRYGKRTPRVTIPAGQTGVRAVTARLAGLRSGARYHYRLVAEPASGAAVAGANISVRTANLDRLVLAANPDGACQGGVCRITGFSVAVRGRDGDTNRPLVLRPGAVRATVRCLSGCSVSTRFRLSGRNTLRAQIGRLVGGRSLPSGATIEVRVTGGARWMGAAYRATFVRSRLVERICEIRPGGRTTCTTA
ncbi:MAG: hypothetical protein IT200_00355 [Thermoleophilia bacterium]|nr:hypothetical protein [Thermoleophilia bacterium]